MRPPCTLNGPPHDDRLDRLVLRRMPLAYVLLDADLRIREWNPAAERTFGYARDEVLGRDPFGWVIPAAATAQVKEAFRRNQAGDLAAHSVNENVTRDGRAILCEWHNTPLFDADRTFLGLLCLGRDVTERVRLEEEVREWRGRYEAAVLATGQVLYDYDVPADHVTYGGSLAATLGYAPEELAGGLDRWLDLVHPDDLPAVEKAFRRVMASRAPFRLEYRFRHKGGHYVAVDDSGSTVFDAAGAAVRVIGLVADLSERRRAEQSLRLQARVLESMAEGVGAADEQGIILYANPAEEALFGYGPGGLLGRHVTELADLPPEELAREYAAIGAELDAAGKAVREVRNRRRDGSTFLSRVVISQLGRPGPRSEVWVREDITARRRLEEQLRQAQKLEAVGRLAGGVAHEFNNLLTVITGYAELLLGELPARDPGRERVRSILDAAGRAASLTAQLLAFGRKSLLHPRVVDLNAVVRDVQKLLGRLIGEDVELVTALDPGAGPVRVDPGQLGQALINLAVNARDAMPRGGRLTLATRAADVGPAGAGPGPCPGVVVEVSDTGHGMDEATRAHIFEPFFTTKGVGEGTGLGLAMVHGFVEQSGGRVEVESAPGRGATFRLYLPRAADAPAAPPPAPPDWLSQYRGTETVLLVEDEDSIRALACQVLGLCGYSVLAASDGREALAVAAAHRDRIHLLATDVVMPQQGGREVAEAVGRLHPEARVLFVSGYTDEAVLRHGVREGEAPFLHKPYSPAALAEKVRQVLDAPA